MRIVPAWVNALMFRDEVHQEDMVGGNSIVPMKGSHVLLSRNRRKIKVLRRKVQSKLGAFAKHT